MLPSGTWNNREHRQTNRQEGNMGYRLLARGQFVQGVRVDITGEQQEDGKRGSRHGGMLPSGTWNNREHRQTNRQEGNMGYRLLARGQFVQGVRVDITEEQHELKEEHAGAPDSGGSSKPGQDHFGDDRLHLEQEESGQRDGQGVEEHFFRYSLS